MTNFSKNGLGHDTLGLTDNPAPIANAAPVLRLPAAFPRTMLPELKSYVDFLIYKSKAE